MKVTERLRLQGIKHKASVGAKYSRFSYNKTTNNLSGTIKVSEKCQY